MQRTPVITAAAALLAVTLVSACEPGSTAAQPLSPGTAAGSTGPVAPLPATAPDAPTTLSPADVLAAAAAATKMVDAAFVRYAATGFETLTATSWAASVTAAPPAASGSANLLIDGRRVQSDFDVASGRLRVENVDGVREDVGAARGVLDPPELLDRITGLSTLLPAVTDAVLDAEPATLNDRPMVRVHAQLPAADAHLLLPSDALASAGSVPVALWLDPASGYTLRQLILTTGSGAVTVSLDPQTS